MRHKHVVLTGKNYFYRLTHCFGHHNCENGGLKFHLTPETPTDMMRMKNHFVRRYAGQKGNKISHNISGLETSINMPISVHLLRNGTCGFKSCVGHHLSMIFRTNLSLAALSNFLDITFEDKIFTCIRILLEPPRMLSHIVAANWRRFR